jgi:hypothetical protein
MQVDKRTVPLMEHYLTINSLWWHKPVVIHLKRVRQVDCELKASLGYIAGQQDHKLKASLGYSEF